MVEPPAAMDGGRRHASKAGKGQRKKDRSAKLAGRETANSTPHMTAGSGSGRAVSIAEGCAACVAVVSDAGGIAGARRPASATRPGGVQQQRLFCDRTGDVTVGKASRVEANKVRAFGRAGPGRGQPS